MGSLLQNDKIRNIAIIAHVDHGKTTLVDFMFRQSGILRTGQRVEERIMDSMDLERERGITIAAKNCSVLWKGTKINILDTPGHADFGGEVERALMMVDGAILLVDAAEGPLPQTRFVLKKALEARLKLVVVINKVDRKDARPMQVLDEVYDLFLDLGADDDQIDFPVLYAIGREGVAMADPNERGSDLSILFDTILDKVPAPSYDPEEPFQMLVSDLGYSDYVGRLAIGKVFNGSVKRNQSLVCLNEKGEAVPLRVTRIQTYEGLDLKDIDIARPGDIIVVSGIENVKIGDTICTGDSPKALKRATIDEPTVSMKFTINTSPFSGRDGKFVQSAKLRERLLKETLRNVALRVEDSPEADSFIVKGRGEFQMAILIETMRREGYEFAVGRPQVILKRVGGKTLEPIEHLYVDCDSAFVGAVTERLSSRRGRIINMVDNGTGRVRIEFSVPSRALIGYRDQFLTDTKGTGIMSSYLAGYEEYRGEFARRTTGSIVADRLGVTVAYALFHLEPRGRLFVAPGEAVYEGMVIGEHSRGDDLNVNPCKGKKLTSLRAAGKDENIILAPVVPMTLEKAIGFIRDDELVEVTPKVIRIRKEILPASERPIWSGTRSGLQGA